MEENNFFKLVWRFNGVVIAFAGALAIVLMVFATYKIYGDVTRERNVRNIVNVEETEVSESWQLGYLSSVNGTSYVVLPLTSDQSLDRSYYSKSSSAARNYLFIDTEGDGRTWLLEHNNFLFENRQKISHGNYSSTDEPVLAFLYRLVKRDTDNDGRLTNADLKTLALSNPDGSKYTEVLTDIDAFLGSQLTKENTILVVYQREGIGYTSIIDLDSFSLKDEAMLPKVGF